MVIDLLPLAKADVERGHRPGEFAHLLELLRVGPVGPLHTAVEHGRAGRGSPKSKMSRQLAGCSFRDPLLGSPFG